MNTVLAPNSALGLFPDDHMAAPPKFHYPWPALKLLDLSKNEIAELSETFGYLTRLETLNLGRNKLSALSVTLALLTRLKELELENARLRKAVSDLTGRWRPSCAAPQAGWSTTSGWSGSGGRKV
jgi:Leucine-rich repeat (LRR) protein